MAKNLNALAESYGIQIHYTSETGNAVEIPDEAKIALLKVLNVDPEGSNLGTFDATNPEPTISCALPSAIAGKRLWGVTCQLYALRSARNLGIGDFEDLAQFAELLAPLEADFVGVNPLNALFLAAPERTSPYSPSTRRYLNPLYIAVDRISGGAEAQELLRGERPDMFRHLEAEFLDYRAVSAAKISLLRRLFETADLGDTFKAFCQQGGESLWSFALFEAISQHETAAGGGAGWNNWPGDMHRRDAAAVKRFEAAHEEDVRFHLWLQYVADTQLAQANLRAKKAGMRVGLYLDFAVGVAPDGAETWAEPDLAVRGVRVGSPPDVLNSEGQDWGLAPLSPNELAAREFKPLADAYTALMKNAGAIRIDHAMGLARLWWVPASGKPNQGGYMRYPFADMLTTVAEASQQTDAVVIGEDLGTVPDGFREATQKAGIFSYRVLYFEKGQSGAFNSPETYPERALAGISTHDLATLAGWWTGKDIQLRAETGRQSQDDTRAALQQRQSDRSALLHALADANLLDDRHAAALTANELPEQLDDVLFLAIHRFVAKASSILFAVQLDDLLKSEKQANLPGTTNEYPNWRIRAPCTLEQLGDHPMFRKLAEALREERPRS